MKKQSYLLCAVIAGLLTGCGDSNNDSKPRPNDQSPLLNYMGTWGDPGTGLALTIDANGVSKYHFTRETCVMNTEYSLDEAEAVFLEPNAGASNQDFSYTFEGEPVILRSQVPPTICADVQYTENFDPVLVFEQVWHTFNDYYPTFAVRQIDWQAQRDLYEPQVSDSTTQEELFALLSSMMSIIDDSHVELTAETSLVDDFFTPANVKGWITNIFALAKAVNIEPLQALAATISQFNRSLERYYGASEFNTWGTVDEAFPMLVWGRLEGNVGYLQINSMNIAEQPLIDQLSLVSAQLAIVLAELADTEAMIVDVRFNTGGSDQFARTVAGHFAEQRALAYTRENYNNGNPVARESLFIEPAEQAYTKPVTLLTSPATLSAAEHFTLAMRTLTHVTHSGERTGGAFSAMLEVPLAKGWHLGLSYQQHYAPDEQQYEVVGITPTNTLPTASMAGSLTFSAFPAIHQTLDDWGIDLYISEAEFSQQLDAIMEASSLPAVSISWTNQERVLSSLVSGFADVDNQRAVTINTPFTLGSVSKTFIGVGAMQMIEDNLLSKDTTIGEINLPITVDSPFIDGNNINFIHLATHSAGILDDDAYRCGYYLNDDNSNLYSLFDDNFSNCPNPVETQQNLFLDSLFNQAGNLYSASHFADTALGENYHYTNTGASLAAEMLSTVSPVGFAAWTRANIFTPLGLESANWFEESLGENAEQPAKRYVLGEDGLLDLPSYALATWAGGNLQMSSRDLATYLLTIARGGELDGTRILAQDSVNLMLSANIEETTVYGDQGVFWTNDGFLFGFNGSDPGVNSVMYYDQLNNLGIVILLNLTDSLQVLGGDEGQAFTEAIESLHHLAYRRGLSLQREYSVDIHNPPR